MDKKLNHLNWVWQWPVTGGSFPNENLRARGPGWGACSPSSCTRSLGQSACLPVKQQFIMPQVTLHLLPVLQGGMGGRRKTRKAIVKTLQKTSLVTAKVGWLWVTKCLNKKTIKVTIGLCKRKITLNALVTDGNRIPTEATMSLMQNPQLQSCLSSSSKWNHRKFSNSSDLNGNSRNLNSKLYLSLQKFMFYHWVSYVDPNLHPPMKTLTDLWVESLTQNLEQLLSIWSFHLQVNDKYGQMKFCLRRLQQEHLKSQGPQTLFLPFWPKPKKEYLAAASVWSFWSSHGC